MMHDSYFWGMGLWHIIGWVILALIVAALIKYLFFR